MQVFYFDKIISQFEQDEKYNEILKYLESKKFTEANFATQIAYSWLLYIEGQFISETVSKNWQFYKNKWKEKIIFAIQNYKNYPLIAFVAAYSLEISGMTIADELGFEYESEYKNLYDLSIMNSKDAELCCLCKFLSSKRQSNFDKAIIKNLFPNDTLIDKYFKEILSTTKSTLLPKTFQDVADIVDERSNFITFTLKCDCGHKSFLLYQNEATDDEYQKIKDWQILLKKYNGGGYSDNNGNLYLVKKGFLGIRKKIKISKEEIPCLITIIKAVCPHCGKEYIIFDSVKNGYDALVGEKRKSTNEKRKISFKSLNQKENLVKIKIRNDISFSSFKKDFPNASAEDFSNAFSEISIYLLNKNKYQCVFNAETR